MPEDTRAVLKELAALVPTAIISGRCLETVEGFVKLKELFYAGSHGLDIKGPEEGQYTHAGASNCEYQPAATYYSTMNEVYELLVAGLAPVVGSSVEHNKYSISAHYRNCNPEVRNACHIWP
eukprot:1188964-Prorocentrum_minimum.AAC.4